MHRPYLLPLLLVGLILFFLPISSSQYSRFKACGPSECKGVNISYPFRVAGQPEYCSLPGLMLTCEDDGPLLNLHQDSYFVRDIDYLNHNLSIANKYFESNQCPEPTTNITLNSTPFYFTSEVQNLFFYLCTRPSIPLSFPLLSELSCSSNETMIGFFTVHEIPESIVFILCEAPLVVPVLESSLLGRPMNDRTLKEALQRGFSLTWHEDGCGDCESSGGRCGYNSSTMAFLCFRNDKDYLAIRRKSRAWLKFVVGLSATIGGLLLAVCIIMFKLRITTGVWKNSKCSRDFENLIGNHRTQMPERYSYSDIRKMTNYLKSKLGEGGFGSVFRGQLLDGRPVAVKILSDSKGKGEDFINEVAAMSRTSHVNIVRLVGFCFQGSHRALVYEFMANGSLEKFIFDKNPTQGPLGWEKLFQIALGIARGLEYLHRGCNTRILHFDIKPHNILLDQDFCPKISDFGLAKLCPDKESTVSMAAARGTMGYIAPEVMYRKLGGVSQKSDVYSYGLLLLEMVGGRKNIDAGVENTSEIYFPDWIYNRLNKDRNLQLGDCIAGTESETARKLIMVGLWCIQTKPMDRPTMSKVVEMLEGNLQVLQMPPKPFLYSLLEAE